MLHLAKDLRENESIMKEGKEMPCMVQLANKITKQTSTRNVEYAGCHL